MNKYKKYYSKLIKEQVLFEKLLKTINIQNSEENKLEYAKYTLKYVSKHITGYFTSSILEHFFIEYGKNLEFNNYHDNYKNNSFLHVLTQGYDVGGHTRVVERWIEYAPQHQKHSVVVLNPTQKLPVLEKNTKEKNGECIYFEKKLRLKEKALNLRYLAQKYEFIILHTHRDDPTATVAFATEKFKRPIIFYNHASHLFWIGKGIADIVADIIFEDFNTSTRRNIKDSFFLGVPSRNFELEMPDKIALRKKLNMPIDKNIIISSGTEYKYTPIGNDSFYNLVKPLLDKNTYIYVIGPSMKNPIWKNYNKLSKGHIIPMGLIPFEQGFLDYVAAGDVYIDSFPLASGTAGMDSISKGTPVIGFYPIVKSLDYINNTDGYTTSESVFVETVKKALIDKNYHNNLIKQQQNTLLNFSKEAWNQRVEEILKITPKCHKVKNLNNQYDYKTIDDYCVVMNLILKQNKIKQSFVNKFIPFIMHHFYKIKRDIKKEIKYLESLNS